MLNEWATQWHAPMLRFARFHLSNEADAEDAVQETFASLLSATLPPTLAGEARHYVFGALRHKIMDRLRQRYKTTSIPNHDNAEDDLDTLLFNEEGHWREHQAPAHWSTPDARLETSQFFQVLDLCMNALPTKPARVFSMKEFLECDAPEICNTLSISQTDYWQCLSRARKQIQLCLNQRWFGGNTQ